MQFLYYEVLHAMKVSKRNLQNACFFYLSKNWLHLFDLVKGGKSDKASEWVNIFLKVENALS